MSPPVRVTMLKEGRGRQERWREEGVPRGCSYTYSLRTRPLNVGRDAHVPTIYSTVIRWLRVLLHDGAVCSTVMLAHRVGASVRGARETIAGRGVVELGLRGARARGGRGWPCFLRVLELGQPGRRLGGVFLCADFGCYAPAA